MGTTCGLWKKKNAQKNTSSDKTGAIPRSGFKTT